MQWKTLQMVSFILFMSFGLNLHIYCNSLSFVAEFEWPKKIDNFPSFNQHLLFCIFYHREICHQVICCFTVSWYQLSARYKFRMFGFHVSVKILIHFISTTKCKICQTMYQKSLDCILLYRAKYYTACERYFSPVDDGPKPLHSLLQLYFSSTHSRNSTL